MLCRLDFYRNFEIEPKTMCSKLTQDQPESHVNTSFKHFVILVSGQFSARTALGQTVQVLSENLHLLENDPVYLETLSQVAFVEIS